MKVWVFVALDVELGMEIAMDTVSLLVQIEQLKIENERLLREWHKADLAKINAEKGTCYHFALNPYDLENMLNCLVDEKISVKKAIELIASWVARNYSDDCLPN